MDDDQDDDQNDAYDYDFDYEDNEDECDEGEDAESRAQSPTAPDDLGSVHSIAVGTKPALAVPSQPRNRVLPNYAGTCRRGSMKVRGSQICRHYSAP